jgi:hypothetical protein
MSHLFLFTQAFSLLIPITLGGIILIACMRKGWLKVIDVPLDGGLKLGGKPLVGKSKSLRSLILYTASSTMVSLVFHYLVPYTPALASVYLNNPFVLGPLISISYLAGEILNSFVKRRLGIATSGSPDSVLGARFQAVIDNVDGIVSTGLVFIFVYQVNSAVLAVSFVLAALMHLGTDILMRSLRLKVKQQ